MKLIIEEPESEALAEYVRQSRPTLVTSRIALVEVPRATAIANPSAAVQSETWRLLESCMLVDVTDGLLRAAAKLASRLVRTLEAIHLASAKRVEPDELLVYDRRLREAAVGLGVPIAHPGASS